MRCLVSILFILSLLAGLSSCRRTVAPAPLDVPVETEDSLAADTMPAESPELREMEASMNLDRDFDDFMYAFVIEDIYNDYLDTDLVNFNVDAEGQVSFVIE